MTKSNIIQLPVTHTVIPVTTDSANERWLAAKRQTRDAVEAWRIKRGKAVAIEPCLHLNLPRPNPGFLDFSVCPDCGESVHLGVAPLPDEPTPPSKIIKAETGTKLEVEDGYVYEGGKKVLSTRARMARLGI